MTCTDCGENINRCHCAGGVPADSPMGRIRDAQADLARTREALRKEAIQWIPAEDYGSSTGRECIVCTATWDTNDGEEHELVTLNGVEGPCPARKEGK